jgi:hypothetical protein
MSFEINDEEREELERLVFELENSTLSTRRHAAELLLLRKLARAVRDCRRVSPTVQKLIARIPRTSDKTAWDLLSAEEKNAAQLELIGGPQE